MSSYYNSYYRSSQKPEFPKLDNEIKIDWDLFYTLLYKQSPSKTQHQDRYVAWLLDYLKQKPGLEISVDHYGNIYVVKGEADLYPCVVCHTDINQDYTPNLKIERNEKWVYGMDMDTGLQCGVGFDDKNGNLFALMMLDRLDTIKVGFFKDEEIGAVGSKQADPLFFADCSMIFQMDRNSYAGLELITRTNGVYTCSSEFVHAAAGLMNKYHVIESTGSFTDVGEIVKLNGVNCIGCNIGAGYFDEHSEQEITSIQALENSINFGYECLVQLGGTKWFHRAMSIDYGKSYGNARSTQSTYYDRYDEFYDIYDDLAYNKSFNVDTELKENKDYRHIFSDGTIDVTDKEIEECLMDGYCPCCFSEHIVEDVNGTVACEDCGSYYYVPEDWFDTKSDLLD